MCGYRDDGRGTDRQTNSNTCICLAYVMIQAKQVQYMIHFICIQDHMIQNHTQEQAMAIKTKMKLSKMTVFKKDCKIMLNTSCAKINYRNKILH